MDKVLLSGAKCLFERDFVHVGVEYALIGAKGLLTWVTRARQR